MKVYVASPLRFSEAGQAYYYGTLIPHLAALGCEVFDPWTLTDPLKLKKVSTMPFGPDKQDAWQKLNREIGANTEAAIRSADMLFAVLDGADVDSGTAAEIGFAFALRIPIVGYRGDFRLAADDEGAAVNLQVKYFILQGGGSIITRLGDLSKAIDGIKARI